jgi:hypothetical protein
LYRDPVNELLPPSADIVRRKYQKLGWSEAKTSRALESKASHETRATGFLGLRADIRDLLADFAQRLGDVIIVVHWYEGAVETEKFALSPIFRISPDQLRHPETQIPVDRLIQVTAISRDR